MLLLLILAQEGGGSDGLFQDPWAWGIGGILFLLVASGRLIVPTFVYDREKARADRIEAEAQRLNQSVQDKTIPALTEAAAAVREAQQVMRELKEEQRWRQRYEPPRSS